MKEGWEYKKLGEVADVAAGQGAPQGEANYCPDGIPFIKAGNLEALISGLPEQKVQRVSAEVAKTHRLKLYKAGSVLFAKSGMSCMKGWVYTLKNDCYVVSHLAIITPQNVKHGFLNYYFQFNKPNTLIKDAAYPSISLKDISNMFIPCPSLSEQQHIVEELDLLSSIIKKKKAQLIELENLAQSLFYEMFGDPITNEKGWEVKKIGEITDSSIGITYKPTAVNDDGVIVLRSSNIQNNEIDLKDIVRVNCKIKDDKFVRNGDILMCTRNGSLRLVGKVAMINNLPERMTYGAFMTVIRSQYNAFLFMFFQLPAFKQQLITAQTATINQITIKMLNDVKVIVPPIELQQQFASKIEAIKHEKELIKQSIKEVTSMYNSRMDFWFNLNK